MEFLVIYWDESDDIHLLKNEYQETYKFKSKDYAESIAAKHELCKVYKIVEINGA